jgi:hypothetical protein
MHLPDADPKTGSLLFRFWFLVTGIGFRIHHVMPFNVISSLVFLLNITNLLFRREEEELPASGCWYFSV